MMTIEVPPNHNAAEARAVVEQMYSAVGLARSLQKQGVEVPVIDADGLLAWAATIDAHLALQEREQPDWLGIVAPSVFDAIRHAFLAGWHVGRLLLNVGEHASFGIYLDERRAQAQQDAGLPPVL